MSNYDICVISAPGDASTADRLADSLRRYRPPKAAVGEDYRRQIVTDTSGSALDDGVREMLDQSRFLVLLCSPEAKACAGIQSRLEYFRQNHDSEHIAAVLVEGEPSEAFPENFTEEKLVRHIMPDMSIVERWEKIEPIAADLRGKTPALRRHALRYETVRITASALGIHPDVLEQRHKVRRRRATMVILAVVGAVSLTAAGIFLRLGLIAKSEGDIAREQTRLSAEIAQRTMEELPRLFAEDELAMEYVDEAVAAARDSLEELGLSSLLDESPAEGVD